MTTSKHIKKPLRLVILLILLALSSALLYWSKQQNTDISARKLSYTNLEYHLQEKGKSETLRHIQRSFYSKNDQVTPEEFSDTLKFLREYQSKNNMDPDYGFVYAQLLRSMAKAYKDKNPNRYQDLLATSVLNFYASALLVETEIARCKDTAAQEDARKSLQKEYDIYRPEYDDLSPKYRRSIRNTLLGSKYHSLNRSPNPQHCRRGAQYMKKILESKQYETTSETTNTKTGVTVKMIESDIEPDYISDEIWRNNVNTIYNNVIQDLSTKPVTKEE